MHILPFYVHEMRHSTLLNITSTNLKDILFLKQISTNYHFSQRTLRIIVSSLTQFLLHEVNLILIIHGISLVSRLFKAYFHFHALTLNILMTNHRPQYQPPQTRLDWTLKLNVVTFIYLRGVYTYTCLQPL